MKHAHLTLIPILLLAFWLAENTQYIPLTLVWLCFASLVVTTALQSYKDIKSGAFEKRFQQWKNS